MSIVKSLFLLLLVGCTLESRAQENYTFTQQFTFENLKDKSQFSVFTNTKSGVWLLTNDDTFNGKVEGLKQWILKPNGEIILLGEDEFGKSVKILVKNPGIKNLNLKIKGKYVGKIRKFGQNKYGWPSFSGNLYALNLGRATSNAYLYKHTYNFSALYAYNFCLDIENPLPVFQKVNYNELIPKNYLVLEDPELKFISLSPSEYYVQIPK